MQNCPETATLPQAPPQPAPAVPEATPPPPQRPPAPDISVLGPRKLQGPPLTSDQEGLVKYLEYVADTAYEADLGRPDWDKSKE